MIKVLSYGILLFGINWRKKIKMVRNFHTTEEKIITDLKNNIGTENYYTIPFSKFKYTDGIKNLIDLTKCYWLISDTAILISSKKELQKPFLLLKIEVTDDKAIVTLKEDSNLKPIYKKTYEYTDFPLKEYEFYICDNVFLLKSEY